MPAKRSRRSSRFPALVVVLGLAGAVATGYWLAKRTTPAPAHTAASAAQRAEEIAHETPDAEALAEPADDSTHERNTAGNVKKKSR